MDKIEHSHAEVGGLKLHVAEIGTSSKSVIFLHGFPEIWYTWRHQMVAVANAGYRAIIHKLGRKPLLCISTIGMTVSLFSIRVSLSLFGQGSFVIALAILFVCGSVAFFSIGLGPICWVVSSEIFPLRVRAQTSALGAVANRLCGGLITMSFLSISRAITVGGTFFVFAALSALAVVFVYMLVPETKGKTLEQIEKMFQNEHEFQGSEMELEDFEQLVQNKTNLTK